ncbi:MAG TPA: Zn-ribbon domain-containing OB-fold protein [Hyphomicrobiaceae bacterium]|nr:Zn-ribbon domain-containing OB-fold protein [Hyphomicrobiaceae bacterium]
MTTDIYAKLVPEPTHESKAYWDGLNAGRLLLQKCDRCGKVRHYPRPMCDGCHSFETRWIEATGRGTIHSWTITHHPFHPAYKSELPYVLVTVDLEEGVRMQTQLRAPTDTPLKIGLPVRVVLQAAKPGLTLPAFALA